MRSFFGSIASAVRNRAPVPLADDPRPSWGLGLGGGHRDMAAPLRTTSVSGTMFSIVNRLSVAAAAPEWHMHRTGPGAGELTLCPHCNELAGALVTDHLALRIWNKPNDFFTRNELVESGQQHQDLAGETWLVVERYEGTALPRHLWLVRPDRMEPVPSPTEYLAGYVYKGPRGERVPLDLDEVIFMRTPDPDDPFRGLGPVPSILPDIASSRAAADYLKAFFLNSAEPGGVIEVPTELSDPQFTKLRTRWNEQHKGVSRAHRVAILEYGKWVDRKYTHKDMELGSLRTVTRDVIMEAYGVSKFALGIVDDVNRATADAAKAWFGEQLTVPRLNRWRAALNADFLPMFGSAGQGVAFAYNNPVPPDPEQRNAELTAKSGAYASLVSAGAHPDDAAEVCGLPPMRTVARSQPEPEPAGAAA